MSVPAKQTAKERRVYRVEHGLCPECGKEAAPYYLCHDHRSLGMIRRMMNKAAERGIVQKSRRGRDTCYAIPPGWCGNKFEDFDWGKSGFDMDPDDKRLRPRMGQRPIDIDETLLGIFHAAGKPLQMDEIYAAWGKLRSKRKTETLAGDMAAIIAAQRKRQAKGERLAAQQARQDHRAEHYSHPAAQPQETPDA